MKTNKWFSTRIISWYQKNKRDLPWRKTTNPYLIWLSEIILQQTRVDQGLPYYQRFASKYPTVHDLAKAQEPDVMKAWEGLGYYSRARNLHATAKHVSKALNGVFPSSYASLIKLKGVGPYTAAAISSIAANEAVAVVDGNVYRCLSRIFGIDTPIDTSAGQKEFTALANLLLDKQAPSSFNQGIMEFGATQCTPKKPACTLCVFSDKCHALAHNTVDSLPIKRGKTKVRVRFFNFLEFDLNNKILIERRGPGDIWQGLYQYPLIESASQLSKAELNALVNERFSGSHKIEAIHAPTKHILSHQHIYATLWRVKGANAAKTWGGNLKTLAAEELGEYALPRVLTRWLETRGPLE